MQTLKLLALKSEYIYQYVDAFIADGSVDSVELDSNWKPSNTLKNA